MKEVIIEGLFGAKDDARIRMPNTETPLLILTGLNGSGKTTLFRMILAIQRYDYPTLTEVRFKQISFVWADSTELHVARQVSPDGEWASLVFAMRTSQGNIVSADWQSGSYRLEEPESPLESLERESDEALDEPILFHELERLRSNRQRGSQRSRSRWISANTEIPETLQKSISRLQFEYIDASRFAHTRKPEGTSSITEAEWSRRERTYGYVQPRCSATANAAEEVSDRIKTMASIASEMTSDASDDMELLSSMMDSLETSTIEVHSLARDLRNVYERLYQHIDVEAVLVELAEVEVAISKKFASPTHEALLQFYLQLANRRTSYAQALTERIDKFVALCNTLFRGKEVSYVKDTGLVAISDYTGANIPLAKLSSGEQHLIAVAGAAFFPIEGIRKKDLEASVLLIDEPEISLHILWQSKLRDALISLSKSGQKLMLATHSTDILTGYLGLEVVMPSPPKKRKLR